MLSTYTVAPAMISVFGVLIILAPSPVSMLARDMFGGYYYYCSE
jgi:hypothetical protein